MSEFKFPCPKCHQRIQASSEWVGREIPCPACKSVIVIPPPGTEETPSAQTTDSPKAAAEPRTQTSTRPAPAETGKESTAPAAPEGPVRVAVLSPQVKLDMIRSVRIRISDENRWLPGTTKDGELQYAVKDEEGKIVPVNPAAKEVERLSLMGAVVRELADRNVVRNAQGRRRFLDVEIPEAIREVLGRGPDEGKTNDLYSISHEQCLKVLDVLEQRYLTRRAEVAAESSAKKLGRTRVKDLVTKVEKKLTIPPEDIVTALVHEVNELKHRIEKLEAAQDK